MAKRTTIMAIRNPLEPSHGQKNNISGHQKSVSGQQRPFLVTRNRLRAPATPKEHHFWPPEIGFWPPEILMATRNRFRAPATHP
jgi:hypothetical protein